MDNKSNVLIKNIGSAGHSAAIIGAPGINSGTSTGAINSISTGTLWGYYNCAYCNAYLNTTQYHSCLRSPFTLTFKNVTIEKVENGYIVSKDGKKYIVDSKEKLLEFIE